jgi:hypothetical protein
MGKTGGARTGAPDPGRIGSFKESNLASFGRDESLRYTIVFNIRLHRIPVERRYGRCGG